MPTVHPRNGMAGLWQQSHNPAQSGFARRLADCVRMAAGSNQEEWYRDGCKPVVSSPEGEGRQAFWRFAPAAPPPILQSHEDSSLTEYPANVETGSGSPRRLTESRGNGATRRRSSSFLARERPHGTQVHADGLAPVTGHAAVPPLRPSGSGPTPDQKEWYRDRRTWPAVSFRHEGDRQAFWRCGAQRNQHF